ncbi:hypothetical protein CTI12_AA356130 [Artemisia annua]|uniref:RNA-directed DNA polymerase, eukaryota, Reverse transcriptase zinc-binding domain protein n=1 Tax=Artemisia annua TaxID=35608 RepID=A0A2U1M4J6_ARTAN|nr:hypothetical protein CTI12_AA356130 [Artemisia annua]
MKMIVGLGGSYQSITSRRLFESIRARFFWGFKDGSRGISWVKLNSILLDRNMGGLRVGSLLAKNLGLFGKWKWRFLVDKDTLWRRVIREFYGVEGGFGPSSNIKASSWDLESLDFMS